MKLIKRFLILLLFAIIIFNLIMNETYAWFYFPKHEFEGLPLDIYEVDETDPYDLYYLSDENRNIIKNENNLHIISKTKKESNTRFTLPNGKEITRRYQRFPNNELNIDNFFPNESITIRLIFTNETSGPGNLSVDFMDVRTFFNHNNYWVEPNEGHEYYLNKAFRIKLMHDFKDQLTPGTQGEYKYETYQSGIITKCNSSYNKDDHFLYLGIRHFKNHCYESRIPGKQQYLPSGGSPFFNTNENPSQVNLIKDLPNSVLTSKGNLFDLVFNITFDDTSFIDLETSDSKISSNIYFSGMKLSVTKLSIYRTE